MIKYYSAIDNSILLRIEYLDESGRLYRVDHYLDGEVYRTDLYDEDGRRVPALTESDEKSSAGNLGA